MAPGSYLGHYSKKLKTQGTNYNLDDILNAGVTSDEEMIEWFRKAEFYGIPVTIHTSDIGCSAFKATTTQYISFEKRRISWGLMSITRWESVL